MGTNVAVDRLQFHPLTPERWPDLVGLFQTQANTRSCWCRFWRDTKEEHARGSPEAHARTLETAVRAGAPLGILAYRDGEAIGWCSIAPRETYGRVEATPAIARVDDEPTWSVVCFVVRRTERREGLTLALLRAAVAHAAAQGARVVEGYPVERHVRDDGSPIGPPFRYMGSSSIYRAVGFRDVAPPGRVRRFMRLRVK
jgi:GNAT superfamily N-acetyltransferase